MKKCLYLLIALLALGQTAWAQEGNVNVSNEQELRNFLTSNYTTATLTNVGLINLTQGELVVNRAVTIDLGSCNIKGSNCRIFNVTESGNLTLTGAGYLLNGTADNGAIIYNAGTLTIGGGLTIDQGSASNGGAIYNAGTLTLNGGNITRCNATNGGAIYNTGVLTINEGAIGIENYPNTATDGGAIYNVAGTVNINGGSISYNSANVDGGGIHSDGGSINMTGGSISYNSATNDRGGVILTGNTTMTMSGGSSISDNIATRNDGGVYIGSNASLTINGGSITGNTAQHYAGVRVVGTLTMSSGNINENSATDYSGGVYIASGASLTMTGGSISDNTAPSYAGIRVYGTLNMSGGSVTGNTATGSYGGIRVESEGAMNMSGMPIVMGNLANGNNSNVFLPSNKKITVDDAFTTSATVGVTCAGGVNTVFTSGFVAHSPGTSTVFTSDDDNLAVGISGGEAKLNTYIPGVPPGSIPYLNVDATGEHGTAYCSTYTKMSTISDDNPTLSNGWYVVDKNLTFNTRIRISGTVHLLLMDNTLLKANKGIFVPSGNALHIWAQSYKTTDPNDLTGRITAMANDKNCSGIGGYGSYSYGSYNSDAGYLYFHGGIIIANGGDGASGISGEKTWGTDYSINFFGGFVTGGGGKGGAGIGGFQLGLCSSVLVTGGTVVGIGGTMAAGIGTGYGGKIYSKMVGGMSGNPDDATDVSIVRITGGLVTVWGTSGAGIGGGEAKDTYDGTPLTVYIEGGTVVAYTLSADAQAIGRGANALDRLDNYLNIYDGAKVLASTSINGDVTLQTAGAGRSNYRDYKKIEIRPCDHPEHNNPISYTNNTEDGNLSVNCPYCYTKEPYTFQTTGNWNTAANWLGGFMPGAGKDVAVKAAATIPSNYCAHVDTINMLEGGSLTIADGGQLIHSNAGVTATVQKIIEGYTQTQSQGETKANGWYFIASPISTALAPNDVANMLSGNFDLYRFNPTAQKEWENFKNQEGHPDFTLNNGVGYLYANNVQTTLGFTGELKPYSEADGANQVDLGAGWNLVGNPFACNVFASQPFYKMNETNTGMTAELPTTTAIVPCEGIIVKTTEAGNVAFTKDAPQQSAHPGNIQIALAEANNTRGAATALDNAIVSFDEGSQLGKFYFGEQSANIYLPQGGEAYAIAYSDKQGEMPLNFKANENGTYTLTINPEGVEVGYLHLIDNMTGADIDLLALRQAQGPASYTFQAKTTDYESRFRLVFSNCGDAIGDNGTFAFISNGNIIVDGEGVLQIVDVMGRVILCRDAARHVSTSGMTPGVYVLRLINGNDVKTQKIVVR